MEAKLKKKPTNNTFWYTQWEHTFPAPGSKLFLHHSSSAASDVVSVDDPKLFDGYRKRKYIFCSTKPKVRKLKTNKKTSSYGEKRFVIVLERYNAN